MFQHVHFDVDIFRDADPQKLGWPGDGMSDLGYTGNHEYSELRDLTWSDAEVALNFERKLVRRFEVSKSADHEYESVDEEMLEDPGYLHLLDVGVAGAAITLACLRCIPFASCNGGAFGGHHYEDYPLIAAYIRPGTFDFLVKCAKVANVGLSSTDNGAVLFYSSDIRAMMLFAQLLFERRSDCP